MSELIINQTKDSKLIMLVDNGILLEKHTELNNSERLEGNIYFGKVENVLPGMQSAFIDIGKSKNAFIRLKDLLPKQDEKNIKVSEILNNTNISDVVKPNTYILVQVKRDNTYNKGARLSSHIQLTGKFIVFMPNCDFVTYSQKLNSSKELKEQMAFIKSILPANCGAILRTNSSNASMEDLKKDLNCLTKIWSNIIALQKNCSAPKLLYQENSIISKMITNYIGRGLSKIIVNNSNLYKEICQIVSSLNVKIDIEVKVNEDLLNMYTLQSQLERLNSRKIWLNCGGFITIDTTEALTAIDVNSGKYVGKDKLEKTVFTVNKEASIEIAKQLRLRDIGGIIIIDYIDMYNDTHKKEIINLLTEQMQKDSTKFQISGFTKLNLLELTRRHFCVN